MRKKPLSVSVVIPNWNGKHLLEKNLPAVIDSARGAQIIVADDASSDGSIAFLKSEYPAITVVQCDRQQGFAGNANSGVAVATGDIIVLLNTDVRPKKGFLTAILPHFEKDPLIFGIGCLEKSYEPSGVIMRGRGLARWEKGYFIHTRGDIDASDTAWVSGGSSAYRRSIWNELGGMDTLYNPFYWEDIDISYQAMKAGYRIRFEKKSVIEHFHEEGKIKTTYTSFGVKQIVYRNQFMFLWKNISNMRLLMAHICWTPVRLIQAMVSGDFLMVSGYVAACARLPSIYKSRLAASRLWRKDDASLLPV